MVLGMEIGLSPGDFVLNGDPARHLNFRPMFIIVIVISLEHCTMHSRLVCSSSRSSFSILCILFFLEKLNRSQSVPLCTDASHSADSGSRSCEFCNAAKRRYMCKWMTLMGKIVAI